MSMFEIFEPTLNYLDPISGSFITQFLIAIGGTVLLYIGKVRSFIRRFINNLKNK